MTTDTDPLAALGALLEGGPLPDDESAWVNGIPPVSVITMMTFNHFDNGKNVAKKWMSTQYTMNTQIFTLTEKFTPSAALAAWSGTVQLHDPDFWISYIDHKADAGVIDPVTHAELKEVWRDTYKNYPPGVMLGTLYDKNNGTNYAWAYWMRFWHDKFGEPNLHVMLDQLLPLIHVWHPVKPVPNRVMPIYRAKYDPHNLWIPGPTKLARRKKA